MEFLTQATWSEGAAYLIGAAFAFGGVIGIVAAVVRESRKPVFLSYRDLNDHRITPRFSVGGDAK